MLLRMYGVSTVNSLGATRSCCTNPGTTPRPTVQATAITRTVSAARRNVRSRTFANINPAHTTNRMVRARRAGRTAWTSVYEAPTLRPPRRSGDAGEEGTRRQPADHEAGRTHAPRRPTGCPPAAAARLQVDHVLGFGHPQERPEVWPHQQQNGSGDNGGDPDPRQERDPKDAAVADLPKPQPVCVPPRQRGDQDKEDDERSDQPDPDAHLTPPSRSPTLKRDHTRRSDFAAAGSGLLLAPRPSTYPFMDRLFGV